MIGCFLHFCLQLRFSIFTKSEVLLRSYDSDYDSALRALISPWEGVGLFIYRPQEGGCTFNRDGGDGGGGLFSQDLLTKPINKCFQHFTTQLHVTD